MQLLEDTVSYIIIYLIWVFVEGLVVAIAILEFSLYWTLSMQWCLLDCLDMIPALWIVQANEWDTYQQ